MEQDAKSDITAVPNSTPPKRDHTDTIMTLFAYLGGIFIFSGFSMYIGQNWSTLNFAMKITITFGLGMVLHLLSLVLVWYQKKSITMVSPIFLIAALGQTLGLIVFAHRFGGNVLNFKISAMLIFGTMLIQQLATLERIKSAVLIFTSLVFLAAFLSVALTTINAATDASDNVSDILTTIIIGTSLFFIAYLLDRKTPYKATASFWYCISAILFLCGMFILIAETEARVLLLGICGLMLYVSILIRNKALLFISTVSTIFAVGFVTGPWLFTGPLGLMILGLICFCIGIIILKIYKKYMK